MRVWMFTSVVCLGILATQPGCNKVTGCPQGMEPVATTSRPGKVLTCKGADGTTHRWTEFHEGSGKPRQVCSFVKGKAQGAFQSFHATSGKPWISGEYRRGQKAGVWGQWDERGFKVAEGEYRDGQLVAGAPVGGPVKCESVVLE